MAKVMLALRGEQETAWLFDPGLRRSLANVGATAFQVNVDDSAVEDALRMDPGDPVVALASIWTDGDLRAALGVVAHVLGSGRFEAFRVTEHVRVATPTPPNGERADVVAQIGMLRRPAAMSQEEYLRLWLEQHTPVAIQSQNLVGYTQNVVEELLTPATPPIAGITEELLPMASLLDPHELYGSGGDDAELERRMANLIDSVVQFGAHRGLDLVPTSQYRWTLPRP